MWQGIVWACALIGMQCDMLPDTAAIQAAYEQEASSGKTLHDKGLKVLEVKCHRNSNGPFLCEVTFISVSDPEQRLYFDIVAVAPTSEGWELRSGLCKR
jgi:hypothetical protein